MCGALMSKDISNNQAIQSQGTQTSEKSQVGTSPVETNIEKTKEERIDAFLSRLNAAPKSQSHNEAFALVNYIMDEVENEMLSPALDCKGRMRGPALAYQRPVKDRIDLQRYAHPSHNTFIRNNGAIRIEQRDPNKVLLDKPGADDRKVHDV